MEDIYEGEFKIGDFERKGIYDLNNEPYKVHRCKGALKKVKKN